jgi:hypothetical protein
MYVLRRTRLCNFSFISTEGSVRKEFEGITSKYLDWRRSLDVTQLRTEGHREIIHVIATLGFQKTGHAQQGYYDHLEGNRRPHHPLEP